MSARIGIIEKDVYKSVYLHNTSKLKNLLENLRQNYKKRESVEKLIDLGDINIISKTIDSCIFYNRDKKDPWDGCKPYLEESNSLENININISPVDYYFTYFQNKWYVCEAYKQNSWVTITKFINSIK